jgi:hypothetical protein
MKNREEGLMVVKVIMLSKLDEALRDEVLSHAFEHTLKEEPRVRNDDLTRYEP